MIERMFPVLRGQSDLPRRVRERWPREIPWRLVDAWRAQAYQNHDQTLDRLAERGGLAPEELWAIAHGVQWRTRGRDLPPAITEESAGEWLIALVAEDASREVSGPAFDVADAVLVIDHTGHWEHLLIPVEFDGRECDPSDEDDDP